MNRRRKRRYKLNCLLVGITVFLIVLIAIGISFIASSCSNREKSGNSTIDVDISSESGEDDKAFSEDDFKELSETGMPFIVYPHTTENTQEFSESFDAKYAVIIDTEENEIVACRSYNSRMYPASLTKVMTLIVAVENIDDLSETVTITDDMIAPMIAVDASRVGFAVGETPTLEQVLYGMILPSGADAALAAAEYVAGSEEAFVILMNEKAEKMGLKSTHFTNVVGLHDENHYSTAEDMALILAYAIQNETCREILSTYQYEIPPTEQNSDGILLTSTLFSRMYGDEMPGVVINGGKTGYTDAAGNCIATFAEANGKTYITVLGEGSTKWYNIYDTLSAYSVYCAGGEEYIPPAMREDNNIN